MSRNRLKKSPLLAAGILGVVGLSAGAWADTLITSFTPGDLVVLRGGDSANPDSTASNSQVSIYLDEYTTSGAYVGSVDVPSSGGSALTLPSIGDFQHQGLLNLSTNGNLLSFAGYQVDAGSADANAAGGADQPVIGVVGDLASSLNTSTVVNSYGPGSSSPYIRGAFTNDGSSFWTFGKYPSSGATSNGGIAYVSGTGPGATTTTVEGFADGRDVIAYNGQLFLGAGSSSVGTHGGYALGSGEPTTNLGSALTNNTLLTDYSGGQSASAMALVNIPTGDAGAGTQFGANVLYTIGDQGTPGIVKYYYDPAGSVGATGGATADTGAWVSAGPDVELTSLDNVLNPTGLIAVQDPTNPGWVDITVSGSNGIYTYIDKSGDPESAIPSDAFTLAVAAPDNEAFYGIALAPTAVPEPASIGMVALGGAALLARRRRKA
jgi:PEP-CTERM motif